MVGYRSILAVSFLLSTLVGCGTTRSTDTARAATEMLLVSQAVDRAVAEIDFTPLAGKTVYLKEDYVDKSTVDRGYLISSIRQQILAHGGLLRDDEKEAIYVMEVRTGGLGTDRHSVLVGTPALQLPALVPGIPTSIPEVAVYKKNDQKGVAKIGIFTYNRITGRAVWQSGLVKETSLLKDRWFLGSGPYSHGTIRDRAEFAGEELPSLPNLPKLPYINPSHEAQTFVPPADPTQTPILLATGHQWTNSSAVTPNQPIPYAVMGLTGVAPVVNHPLLR